MPCQCAPSIEAEMRDWEALGGANWGCCGNSLHTYGFHLPGYAASPTGDYSRNKEAPPPYNLNWACAGDFAHRGNPALRARHAALLARLRRGDPALSMICEFIGQPYADGPVYYWAPWNGIDTIKKYTGSGHDQWSHVSWWRSRANQRAYLWAGATPAPSPTPSPTPTSAPPYPGYIMGYAPSKHDGNVGVWQSRMKQRGWRIGVDGYFGNETLRVVRAFQAEKRLGVDGDIGPVTWAAAWTSPVT